MIKFSLDFGLDKANAGPPRPRQARSQADKTALSPEYHIVHRKGAESASGPTVPLIFTLPWGRLTASGFGSAAGVSTSQHDKKLAFTATSLRLRAWPARGRRSSQKFSGRALSFLQ
jgi:hypothetical protein